MVQACSQALPHGECALAAATPESTRTESVAMVLWQGPESLAASVRVGGRDRQWVTRHLTFSNDDPLSDRWTAVGLTVATLVDELEPKRAPEKTPLAASTGAVDEQRSRVRTGAPVPAAFNARVALANATFGLAAMGGPGWRGGGWRRGASALVTLGLPETMWAGVLGVGYAVSDGPAIPELGTTDSRWYSLTLGVAGRGVARTLNTVFVAAVELVGQRATASAGVAHGSDMELRPRARAQASWPASATLGMAVGAAIGLPSFDASRPEGVQLRAPSVTADVLLGVELRL